MDEVNKAFGTLDRMAMEINDLYRHYQSTGCRYDDLNNKVKSFAAYIESHDVLKHTKMFVEFGKLSALVSIENDFIQQGRSIIRKLSVGYDQDSN